MLAAILFVLILLALEGAILILQGASSMSVAQDIKDTQAAVLAALNVIAGQQAASISQADAAAILANEQANLSVAQGLIIP